MNTHHTFEGLEVIESTVQAFGDGVITTAEFLERLDDIQRHRRYGEETIEPLHVRILRCSSDYGRVAIPPATRLA